MLETQLKILALKLYTEHYDMVVIQMILNIPVLILKIIIEMKTQSYKEILMTSHKCWGVYPLYPRFRGSQFEKH